MPRRLAVVDMGSNTLKFSVTELADAGDELVIHAHAETVRLGAGVAQTGRIEPERMARALTALRDYERVASALGAEAFIGVATAALRMASNGDDLLDQIHNTTSWIVRVISGADEATLAFAGLVSSLPPDQESLLVDIGGGSTELISVSNRKLNASESVQLGSGTLADRCFTADPPGLEAVLQAVVSARTVLVDSAVLPIVTAPALVLSGGNGQFLESLSHWEAVDVTFSPAGFPELLPTLAALDSMLVATWLGIAPERARMLPAGAAIAMAVIDLARPQTIAAAPSGIRGGLVAEWIATHP